MTDVTQDRDQDGARLSAADEQLLRELTERARTGGLKLAGEGGLFGRLAKMVLEGALEGGLDDHLGYEKNDPAGRNGGNSRNGYRPKTVLTDTGPAEISVPGDRDSSFDPKIVAKRRRWLTGVGELVVGEGADARGDRGAPGRGLRRRGVQAGDHGDHRCGHGQNGRVAEPAAGPGVGGDLHRRHPGQDRRGPGRQPARLPGPGRHRRRRAGRAGPVGRGARRRGRPSTGCGS